MSIGTCLSPWIWSVKRSPQLIWPHEQVFRAIPWTLNVPDSGLVLVLQGGFYSLRPHGARGRIKDWWELSESVYCSRDPRLCYEWVDCVAVLPQFMRLAQQRSVWQSRLDCFSPPLSLFLFLAQSIASRWIAGALKVANSTVYSGKMWWNTCAIRKKSFHIPTDSCILPDFKVDKGYTHSLLQIMPGPSWINSHFGLSLLHYICLKRTWTEPAQL